MIEAWLIGLSIGGIWAYTRMRRSTRRRLHRSVRQLVAPKRRRAVRPKYRPHPSQGPREFPPSVREYIFRRDGWRCTNCASTHSLQADHIIPYSKGGRTVPSNGKTLCQTCNVLKSNRFEE